MKKFIVMLLIVLSLPFTITNAEPKGVTKTLTEGVYDVNTFDVPLNELHQVQNVSDKDVAYFIVFSEDETIIQSLKLIPNSPKYELLPLDPSYIIVIIGKGTVTLS